jgi:hypothetical protein
VPLDDQHCPISTHDGYSPWSLHRSLNVPTHSPNWIKAFNRRSRVEGWFGNLKNDNTEALGRGAFRVMGICKTSLMVAVFAAATNLRLLRAWARRTLGNDDLLPLLTTGAHLPITTEPVTSNRDTGPPHRQ